MVHRITTIALAGGLAALLVACGGAGEPAPAEPEAAQPELATTAPEQAPSVADAPTVADLLPAAEALRTFEIVPEQSEARYEVQEQFLDQPLPSMAVGKTNAVEGIFQFDAGGKPTGEVTEIMVDLRSLTSDRNRRDQRIREQWLESNTYPYAKFVSTELQGGPESYTEGEEVSFKLVGDMTIREQTRPVTWDVTAKLEGDTVTGTATTRIMMADFGIEPPEIMGMLTVQGGVTLTLKFVAKDAS
jgi:polyisoprenoid-binding protein YceI